MQRKTEFSDYLGQELVLALKRIKYQKDIVKRKKIGRK